MKKIRAKMKYLLANTFAYESAKAAYTKYKLARDKKIFESRYSNAIYINYSKEEIFEQRKLGYCSQYGQDFFLWSTFFSNMSSGKFIDIGANKPITNSNSFFFEKNGWTGVAIEPLKHFESRWAEERKTPFICGAVSDSIGEEPFVEILPTIGWEHALSGFKAHVREEDLKIYKHKEYTVTTKPLRHYIAKPGTIDLIMIDVEGAEMKVLSGIDFALFTPAYLLIENDSVFGGCEIVRQYMKDLGYKCVARIGATDDFFVRQ